MKHSKLAFTKQIELLQAYKEQIAWGSTRPQIERSLRREMYTFHPLDDPNRFNTRCYLPRRKGE